MKKTDISLSIRTPEAIIYEGLVKAVSSNNDKGVFDVLPYHSNFIAIIKNFVRIHQTNGQIREFSVVSGIMRVYKNRVEVFLGI